MTVCLRSNDELLKLMNFWQNAGDVAGRAVTLVPWVPGILPLFAMALVVFGIVLAVLGTRGALEPGK